MAYVQLIKGRWKAEAAVMIDGKKRTQSKRFNTKAEGEAWAEDLEREMRTVKGGGFPRKTVRDLLKRFREEVAPDREGYKWDLARLLAIERRFSEMGFADMQLAEFGNVQMAAVRKSRSTQIRPSSVSREESLLKAVWGKARHPDWNWTDVDPFKDLGRLKGASGQPRDRKGSWRELKRILRELGYHPRQAAATKKAEVGLAMLVALRTTLRSQEVLQLNDDAVDVAGRIIEIGKHKTRYMTNDAKRVPLLPKALVLLRRKCLGRGSYFTVADGSRDTLYRKAKILAGVKDLTFHDLKRTAVIMLKRVLTEDELLAVTGNKDISTLRRHYTRDTAMAVSNMIWGRLSQPGGAGASTRT